MGLKFLSEAAVILHVGKCEKAQENFVFLGILYTIKAVDLMGRGKMLCPNDFKAWEKLHVFEATLERMPLNSCSMLRPGCALSSRVLFNIRSSVSWWKLCFRMSALNHERRDAAAATTHGSVQAPR